MTERVTHAPGWIACGGAFRMVRDGQVACPRPDLVGWKACIDCHLLEAADEDRAPGCAESEPLAPIEGSWSSGRIRPGQLIVELL
jgi:hypothetical protein